jgi:probable rRNA maturation factor
MPVEVDNRTAETVDEAALAALVAGVLEAMGAAEAETSVILVTPGEMRALNAQWRHRDEVTDVLAFPIDESDELPGLPRLLGDVVVCLESAAEQAVEEGHAPGRELAILAVHGTLHLLGYDHESDDGRMLAVQASIVGDDLAVPWPA